VTQYLLAGRYRLTDRIAAGGMGEVWRAFDQLLNRQVAVKVLPTVRAGDQAALARFRAEARFAASLSHPGIAQVYDYGESAEVGGAYLVMELVDGDPLSAILARAGRLSPDVTLDIVGQAAYALDVAHQAGIVHRDIKPGNILIARGGTAKITDFGIATAVRAAHSAQHLTETGMVMGTAMYVSPEQATGSKVTASSDIYSLGVVAFECLSGRPPFNASEPLAIAYAHKHDPVPPLPPDVPPSVVELVNAMLAKTPAGRPGSARMVADRTGVLRQALALGVPPTRMDLPAATGQLPAAMPTRADLPAASTAALFADPGSRPSAALGRIQNPEWAERSGRSVSERPRPRRPLLAAGLTVLVCAIAAAVSFYVSGSILHSHNTGQQGNVSVTGTLTPTPVGTGSKSGSASPSATPDANPGSAVKKQPHPKRSKSASASSSATTSSTPSATASPTPTATASPTPTSSPTPTATSSPTASASATASAGATEAPTAG
jgi:eukaryotic-like serine/threonine-protein kinase